MSKESEIGQLAQEALEELEKEKAVAEKRTTDEDQRLSQQERDLASLECSLDHWRTMQGKSTNKAKSLALVVLDNVKTRLARWSYEREKNKYKGKWGAN